MFTSGGTCLQTSGKKLGAWGLGKYEVIASRCDKQPTTVWTIDEYRNVRAGAELTFVDKLLELHWAMYQAKVKSSPSQDPVNHVAGVFYPQTPYTEISVYYFCHDKLSALVLRSDWSVTLIFVMFWW